MSLITLDGRQFSDIDSHLLGALTLAALSGQAVEITPVGRGVNALHLTVVRALAALCEAEVEGDTMQAPRLRFVPRSAPRAQDLLIDMGAATGRPSALSVTPVILALLPVLARAPESSLIRLRGATATPYHPSVFWLRETLLPMLDWFGLHAAIEIEKWGWYPDGGGESTLLVEGQEGSEGAPAPGPLLWEERGDLVGLWGLIALSPRLGERVGKQMGRALEKALRDEPLDEVELEIQRVRSPGPGSGVFLALQFEQVTAGFEALSSGGAAAEQVVEGASAALSHYFWSDAAFEPALAQALMIPAALHGQRVSYTTSEITLPMRILADLLPRFLPVRLSVEAHPKGGHILIEPVSD